jgi:hypothetical protein
MLSETTVTSTLNMEAVYFSETLVPMQQTKVSQSKRPQYESPNVIYTDVPGGMCHTLGGCSLS